MMPDNKGKSVMLGSAAELDDGEPEQATGGLLATQHTCPSCGRMDVAVGDFIGTDGKHYNRKCRKCGTLFNRH